MSLVRELIAELRERRLWPLALGLLVALVAVPTLLSKPATETVAPQSAGGESLLGGDRSVLTETRPAVSLTQATGKRLRRRIRRLDRKNPFVQQAKPKATATGDLSPVTGAEGATSGSGVTTGTSAASDLGSAIETPTTSGGGSTETGQTSEPVFFEYTASVSFGEVGKVEKKTLQRLETLPSEENPVIVFMGVLSDGETAVFLVSSTAVVRGDAECKPEPSRCQFIYMKKDDLELIDVPGANETVTTYELELLGIEVKELKKSEASSSSTRKGKASAHASTVKRARARKAARSRAERRLFGVFQLIGF